MTSGSPGGWPATWTGNDGTSSAKRSRKKRTPSWSTRRQRRQVLVGRLERARLVEHPVPGAGAAAARRQREPQHERAAEQDRRDRGGAQALVEQARRGHHRRRERRERDGEQRVDADVRVAERRRPRRADRRVGEAADDQPDRDRDRADREDRVREPPPRARERRRAPSAVVMAPPGCRGVPSWRDLADPPVRRGAPVRARRVRLAAGLRAAGGRRAAGRAAADAPPAGRLVTGTVERDPATVTTGGARSPPTGPRTSCGCAREVARSRA